MKVHEITESKQQLDEWFFVPAMLLGAAKFIAGTVASMAATTGIVMGVPLAKQWLSTLEANSWKPPKGFMPDKTQITLDKTHKDYPGKAIWSDSKQEWSLEKTDKPTTTTTTTTKTPVKVDKLPGDLSYPTGSPDNPVKAPGGPNNKASNSNVIPFPKKEISKGKFVLSPDDIKKAFAQQSRFGKAVGAGPIVFKDQLSLLRKMSQYADSIGDKTKNRAFTLSGQNLQEKIKFEEGKAGGISSKTITYAKSVAIPFIKAAGWIAPAYIIADAFILKGHYDEMYNGKSGYEKGKYPLPDGGTYTSDRYNKDINDLSVVLEAAIVAWIVFSGASAVLWGLISIFWRIPKFAVGFNKKTAGALLSPGKAWWNPLRIYKRVRIVGTVAIGVGGTLALAEPKTAAKIAELLADVLLRQPWSFSEDGKSAAGRLVAYLANGLMDDTEFYRDFKIVTGWGSTQDNINAKNRKKNKTSASDQPWDDTETPTGKTTGKTTGNTTGNTTGRFVKPGQEDLIPL